MGAGRGYTLHYQPTLDDGKDRREMTGAEFEGVLDEWKYTGSRKHKCVCLI